MTLEGELAAFATKTRWDDLPAEARERGRQLLLDAIACAFTGRTAPTRDEFAGAARGLGDGAGHPVVGDATGAGRAASALINAWQTTATTMCDVYRPAMCHVTPPLLGAALAASSAAHSAGELLRA
jgi:2-methylcitrate dehydratase PrpD